METAFYVILGVLCFTHITALGLLVFAGRQNERLMRRLTNPPKTYAQEAIVNIGERRGTEAAERLAEDLNPAVRVERLDTDMAV